MLVRMYVRCAQQHGCNQLVQVLRTGVEKGNPDAVPDADLNEFMAAALAARSGATQGGASAQTRSFSSDVYAVGRCSAHAGYHRNSACRHRASPGGEACRGGVALPNGLTH
jgi:hypothetical protein